MKDELQAIATLFSLVNPAMCAAIFMRADTGRSTQQRLTDAATAMAIVLAVLLTAAFLGSRILEVFGVSLDAFSVAGGGVLAWIGISMLTGNAAPTTADPGTSAAPAAKPDADASLVPLILFAASPGTITGVITIAASHSKTDLPFTAVLAIVTVVAITWLLLLFTARMKDSGSGGMIRDMVTRYMGLIVLAMGIQFMLTGYRAFMA